MAAFRRIEEDYVRSLHDLRQPLYRQYAQLAIDCTGKNHEQIVMDIIKRPAD